MLSFLDQKQAVLTRGKNAQNTIFYPTVYRFCGMSKSASDRQSLSRHLLTGYSTLSLMKLYLSRLIQDFIRI